MSPDKAAIEERLAPFAALHARELEHIGDLNLPDDLKEEFRRLSPYKAGAPHLETRLIRGLRLEGLEAFERILAAEDTPSILDCGSGWGTQAILFAMLGAKVIGVELLESRVDIANARLEWYREQTGQDLDVQFIARNVFPVLKEHPCRIVWVCQAISHIHPAEDFLDGLHDAMPPGGEIIISDANWLDPRRRVQLYRQYWRVHKKLKWYTHSRNCDPVTGEAVEMAEERMFSPRGLAKLMRGSGFEVLSTRTSGFVPVFRLSCGGGCPAILRTLDSIDGILSHVPGLGSMGTFLVGVGRKGGAA